MACQFFMNEDKYKQLKRRLKEVIEENERVNERLSAEQYRNRLLQKEKELLLERVCELDADLHSSDSGEDSTLLSVKAPDRKPPVQKAAPDLQPPKKRQRRKTPDTPLKLRRTQEIPLDELGQPIFPIQIGILHLISLGEIVSKPAYHNERYIYPVGFCTERHLYSF